MTSPIDFDGRSAFTYTGFAARVIFGEGSLARLPEQIERLGAPTSLREIGMPAEGLDRAADLAVQNPYRNPRPIERDAILAMLDDAWHGGIIHSILEGPES